MSSEPEPLSVEPDPKAQVDSSKNWLGLRLSQSTKKINDMRFDQVVSDPSTYVKKRTQRHDDSILLRHLDDVVRRAPEEHSYFEHMKTSLHLADVVVVLRNEGDTVNSLGLEITKTSSGFEVRISTDLVEFLLSLRRLDNSKPIANQGRRSTVLELASARQKRLCCYQSRNGGASEHVANPWYGRESRRQGA